MPKWWIHNKWATKFGITLTNHDLNWINDLVDDPKKHVPNWLVEHTGHDWGRRRKWEMPVLEAYACKSYGHEGALAVHLHHLLDILDVFTNPQKRQQMYAFKEATREAKGTTGTVRRFDGKPSRNPAERIIPSGPRRIQGLLGKCCYCGRSLGGEPHRELTNIRGKNVCAHVKCLRKRETYRFSNKMQIESENQGKAIEKPVLDVMQIKKKVMKKAIGIKLEEEVIEFVMKHFWQILNDIENSRVEKLGKSHLQ